MQQAAAFVLGVALVISASACGRERVPDAEECVSWRDDLEQRVSQICSPCHIITPGDPAPPAPAGSYDLSRYQGALGAGSDGVANAIAGDPDSLLLAYLEPDPADPAGRDHAGLPGLSELRTLARRWVVECRLAYARSAVHPGGIMNPADPAFHGRLLFDLGWAFDACEGCHDAGNTGVTGEPCTSCHPAGPTDCTTCHGDGPTSGAHAAHRFDDGDGDGGSARSPACALCHAVPADWDAPGHIVAMTESGPVADPPPAEIAMTGLAAQGADPRYDAATGACAETYCHGGGFDDVRAANTAPVWTAGPDQVACGTCHGVAPASHADDRCGACHPTVADDAAEIVGPALHVDGAIALGRAGEACTSCHGPPPDVSGETSTDAITVGAHQSHVDAIHGLRGPIPCGDCHIEPAAVDSPGHIDSAAPAEVFPGGAGGASFGGLAAAGGAVPVWDRASATCADVYCHGGGTTRLADDTAPGLLRAPAWTAVGADQAGCGTCHGAPPIDGLHAADLQLSDCRTCHAATVDAFGNVLVSGPPGAETSAHIDGVIQVGGP